MNNKIQFFSIHDILNFAIIDHTGYFNRLFDSFYEHYINFKRYGEIEDCDLVIELGNFNPNLDNSYNVGNGKYFFQENYMYVPKEQYKGAKWRFDVQGLNGGKTIVRIDFNYLGRLFITGNVIDFLIHLKLLEKGYPVMHASAVEKNGSAFVFSSRGGGGKTTIALEMMTNGFNFIGDNYIIIHNNEILSFPTSLSIFTYNMAPIIYRSLTFKERIMLEIKKLLYKMTGGYAKFFTKINPKRLYNISVLSSRLNTVLILIPNINTPKHHALIEKLDYHKFAKHIRYNQMLEFSFFNRYIDEYAYLFPQENLSAHWQKYEESIFENSKCATYVITVPQKYDKNSIKNIMGAINIEISK